MTTLDEIKDLQENIQNIDIAIKKAIMEGGIVSYTLNSGQGSTTVRRSTLKELSDMRRELVYLYNEKKAHYSGSNISIIRNSNVFSRYF